MAFQLMRVTEQGKLSKDEEGWKKLASLPGPLYILSIIGVARSGKSSLLNMLMALFNPNFQGDWLETSALAQYGNTEGIWGLACAFPAELAAAASSSSPSSSTSSSSTSSSSSAGTLLLLDTQGLEMGGGLDRLLTFSTLLSSELLIMALTALNDCVLKELQVMTMVGQKVTTSTHFPNLSLVLRTGLHFGGSSPHMVLDNWLSVNDPRRNVNLDTTRDQIRRLFTKNRRLFSYRVASQAVTDILDGPADWSTKMLQIQKKEPEFYQHFVGLAGELVPKMEPKQFHNRPISGAELVEVADLMLVSLNNEAKFDVDTSFGEVFFTKALPDIKESLRAELAQLDFASVKSVVTKSDEICLRALEAFGELLTPGQERRLRRMVLEMVCEWVVLKAQETRGVAISTTKLTWGGLVCLASITPPRYSMLWLLFAAFHIHSSFKHLVASSALRSSPMLMFVAHLLVRAGVLDNKLLCLDVN